MSVGEKAGFRKQISLPFSKAIEIAMKSIKIRFWRSMITAAGIFLGIAFFSSVRMAKIFSDVQTSIVKSRGVVMQTGAENTGPAFLQNAALIDDAENKSASTRLDWLSIMALIVCTVGITNAMLMSVTERYKEIGTMKCLGALDSLIVRLFFIESVFLGFLSSLLGFAIGWLVISLVHLFMDGVVVFGADFWLGTLKLMFASVGVGTFLTFIATIAPAIRAAQMPPAAALRVEV